MNSASAYLRRDLLRPIVVSSVLIGAIASLSYSRLALAQKNGDHLDLREKHLVDIGGGRHRNLICFGRGAPTVVFEQGAGSEIVHWSKVQSAVSAVTRTCFYDRAGYGYSDPVDGPMTLRTVTDDLHALLDHADIQDPIVLVGHSLGGLYATYYADRFPERVAGMVLVDPAFSGMYDAMKEGKDGDAFANLVRQTLQGQLDCSALARRGKLTQSDRNDCFPPGPHTSAEDIAYMDRFTKPYRYDAIVSEMNSALPAGASASENETEERTAKRSFGTMPMVVLTAERPQRFPVISEQANQANLRSWKLGHDKLAARSARGRSLVVPQSGHFIQLDQPKAVIDAILEVVQDVRKAH